jgi:hypothetical protein
MNANELQKNKKPASALGLTRVLGTSLNFLKHVTGGEGGIRTHGTI